ncbi:MFS transporter [Aliivibrio sp. S4TY2]|uniref:MFS transporter n=1 Tax=unclassified Aliivibrio TaxID=2645654 RepID=UPI002379345C|nr:MULTISPECIES: MFS transporter [unclassified Aliivibrio]MDD9155090.1 MFS transporter [Aliivibrio sp. S4TY2]MDD9159357.1 MFS transporter [Aliivibrio sp. S4TY1]MDD9163093.1 MFS transporter [Aliivibrio sp. S4MY2]MDD9167357.1 MFS transporter [Aliivibrio sp. S4MY4]MDD9184170.1 MFS transporter [Aliivibrio sp. S4MY3]
MIEFRSKAYYQVSAALAFGSFLVFCNLYLFQPMLPVLADHFMVSATQINWLLAAGTLMLALSLLPWAIASDFIGRRKVILLSLFMLPVIGVTSLLTDSLIVLILSRAAMGIALAGFAAVAVAYMADAFTAQAFSYAIGAYISANSLGGISGRLFGGVITDHFSWQMAVILMALISAIGAIIVALILPKDTAQQTEKRSVSDYHRVLVQHLRNKQLFLAMLIGGVNFALFVNLYSVTGFRLIVKPYSLPLSVTSMIFLCYLSGTVSSRLVGLWCQHFNAVSGMLAGTLLSLIGMGIASFESLTAIVIGLNILSFGAFFTHSLAYGWVSQKAETAKSTATALYLVHYYVSGSLGGFYLMYCWQHGGWESVVLGAAVLYIVIFGLCWRLYNYAHTKEVWA